MTEIKDWVNSIFARFPCEEVMYDSQGHPIGIRGISGQSGSLGRDGDIAARKAARK